MIQPVSLISGEIKRRIPMSTVYVSAVVKPSTRGHQMRVKITKVLNRYQERLYVPKDVVSETSLNVLQLCDWLDPENDHNLTV